MTGADVLTAGFAALSMICAWRAGAAGAESRWAAMNLDRRAEQAWRDRHDQRLIMAAASAVAAVSVAVM